MKWLFCVVWLVISCPVWASTINAASCSQANVQTAINSAVEGDTVLVPATSSTWSTGVTVSKGITLDFQGCAITLSGTQMINATCSTNCGLLSLMNGNITGTTTGGAGAIAIDGHWPNRFRIGHWTVTNLTGASFFGINQNTWYLAASQPNYGLIDHLTYTTNSSSFDVSHCAETSGVNDLWLSDPHRGTEDNIFIEDSTISYPASTSNSDLSDSSVGCEVVFRHNSFTSMSILSHDTASNPQTRGVRWTEIYNNTFNTVETNGSPFEPVSLRGGTGVYFNNTIPIWAGAGTHGWTVAFFTQIQRTTQNGSAPMDFQPVTPPEAHKVCSDVRSHCSGTTNDHPACGAFTSPGNSCTGGQEGGSGTCNNACTVDADCGSGFKCPTNFDGAGTGGYLVRDQTGASADDPATHVQIDDPSYFWDNIDSNNGNAKLRADSCPGYNCQVQIPAGNAPYIQINREFYFQVPTFNGTVGVGSGLLASRPATCTTGVGYFATDSGTQGTLYKCTVTNTWTSFYQPYTYPHPLQGGVVSSVQPPTNVTATVH